MGYGSAVNNHMWAQMEAGTVLGYHLHSIIISYK